MQTLPAIDPLKATGETKEVLERVEQRIGWVPKMITLLANSPAATEAYLQFNVALARAALPRHTRLLIAATVAELNGCTYSAMIASGQAKRAGVPEDAVAAARRAKSKDPKVAAALRFAVELIQQRGKLPPTEVALLRSAGYSDTEIVDIVATVVLSLFRNYFNLIAGTEIESVTKHPCSGLTAMSPES
jgi:uncharacterized peroxidase-related enzyme